MKSILKACVLLMLLLPQMQLEAQHASQARTLLFRQLSIKDGLSQSTVNSIAQDRSGYLWLATEDGLNKYDGTGFKNYRPVLGDSLTLSSVDLVEALLTTKGDLIVSARNAGLNIWDPVLHRNRRISKASGLLRGLPSNFTYDVSEDRYGRIWAATDSGLAYITSDRKSIERIDDSAIRSGKAELSYSAIAEIEQDVYWAGIISVGLVQFNLYDKSFSIIADRRSEEFKGIILTTIFKESNGNIWVGTRAHGILHWKASTKKWQRFNSQSSPQIPSDYITAFAEDLEGNIWVGSHGGLLLYDEDERSFTSYTVDSGNADGLTEDYILNIFIDRSNNLWLGTRQRGVFIADLKKKKFEHFDFTRLAPRMNAVNLIWAFADDDDGNLWVGTEAGLMRLNSNYDVQEWFNSKYGQDNIRKALKQDFIGTLAADGDYLWLGTGTAGLQRFNRKKRSMDFVTPSLSTNLPNHDQTIVVRNISGRIYVGTFTGLYAVDKTTLKVTHLYPENAGSSPSEIWDIVPDKDGSLWLPTKHGLKKYNPDLQTFQSYPISRTLDENMTSVHVDSSIIWVTTSMGLVRFEPGSGEYRHYTEVDGLPNPFVYGVAKARDGELWASTNRGLSRVRYSYTNADSISFRNYAHLDGVHNLEYNGGAIHRTKNGTLLFGGVAGVDVIVPDDVYDNPFEPNVVVNDVTVFDGSETKNMYFFEDKQLRLRYFENVFTINVAALEYTQPELNRYTYMLENFDKTWIQSNSKPFIVYTNLDPGKYVFKVRASNNDGIWTTRATELRIEIVPPFWRTAPFYAFCLLFVFSGIAISINMRERKLKVHNQQLEERVALRTKELKESEEIFRLISETALDLIAIVDERGTILYANPAHRSILGYDETEFIGQPMSRFVHPDDVERNKMYFRELILTGKGSFPDYRIRHKNGSWLVFASSAAKVAEAGGGNQRFVMLSHDYSKQREITEQLTRSKEEAEQASRSKSAFLASMSHELKTPLNSILGFTQIMQEDSSLSDRHRNNLSNMYESGKHLLKMIEEILALSKIEAGRMQVLRVDFEIDQLFRELLVRTRKAASENSIQVTIKTADGLPGVVNADYDKILSILFNILDNAVKHSGSGVVMLEAGYFNRLPAKRDSLHGLPRLETLAPARSSPTQEMIRFVIKDSGGGIPPDDLDSIFRPFNKTNPNFSRGIGLGLAISWRLIALLEGWLEIYAEENKGSELHVWIPVSLPVSPVKFASNPAENARFSLPPQQDTETKTDPVAEIIEAISGWKDEASKSELIDALELMDAEMIERVLSPVSDERFQPLKHAAQTRNFSLLIALNERLHPMS
jgi:PAS domain S-box-containing protein